MSNLTTTQPTPYSEYERENSRQHLATTDKPLDTYKPNWFQRKWRSYKALVASGPSDSFVDRGAGGVQGQLGMGVYKAEMGESSGGTRAGNEEMGETKGGRQ